MPNLLHGIVTKTGAMRKTVTVTVSVGEGVKAARLICQVKRTFEHPKLLKVSEEACWPRRGV